MTGARNNINDGQNELLAQAKLFGFKKVVIFEYVNGKVERKTLPVK